MNRNELAAEISKKLGSTKREAALFINAYEESVKDAIRNGNSVLLHGFMRIERRTKAEYIGHDFGTKNITVVPEHDYVKIRPGTDLCKCVE